MKKIIPSIAPDLLFKDGIWFAKETSAISYPSEGNDACFELEDTSFWFKHRNNCIKTVIEKFASTKTLFDIGGGNGYTAKALENADIQTVLVEPGISGVLNAQKRGVKNLVCATLKNAKFRPDSIPNLGLFDVLEHIEDDSAFLHELHSVLQADGKLFITVPAFNFLWSEDDKLAGHFRRYTMSSLKKTALKAGFDVVYASYFFSVLTLPVFLLRTIPGFFNIKKVTETKKEHKAGKLQFVFDNIWKKEVKRIKNGKKIPIGSSLLMVLNKRT